MKHYVSKEVAEKLYRLGFDELIYENDKAHYLEDENHYIKIPEMYEVQDWFRDKGIDILVVIDWHRGNKSYSCNVTHKDMFSRLYVELWYNDYYEALEAGINKAIEIYEQTRKD